MSLTPNPPLNPKITRFYVPANSKACDNDIRVRRDVAEEVILRPVVNVLLGKDVIAEMVKEMRGYYAERMAELRAMRATVPAEVEDLDRRIARLRDRLKVSTIALFDGAPSTLFEGVPSSRSDTL